MLKDFFTSMKKAHSIHRPKPHGFHEEEKEEEEANF